MKPISSFREVCRKHALPPSQIATLQSLADSRKSVLHPYWIQLALFVPHDFATRLHDDLVANEWISPDRCQMNGITYETELSKKEVEAIAFIEWILDS